MYLHSQAPVALDQKHAISPNHSKHAASKAAAVLKCSCRASHSCCCWPWHPLRDLESKPQDRPHLGLIQQLLKSHEDDVDGCFISLTREDSKSVARPTTGTSVVEVQRSKFARARKSWS